MRSKRYTVIFAGLNPDLFLDDTLAKIWERAADQVYYQTGIYVNARMDVSHFICGEIRNCNLGGPSINYTSLWNPEESDSEAAFHDALIQVIRNIREWLNNPYMAVSIDDIEFHYFLKV